MGGFCDSDPEPVPTSTTVVQGTDIPEWVSEGGQSLFNEAKSLAQNEYQPYSGPRIQGRSNNEKQAGALATANAGKYTSDIDSARGLIDGGTKSWTDEGVADSYINPYTKGVTDIAAREVEKRNKERVAERGAKAVQAGAFGGMAHGFQESQNDLNLDQTISDTYLRGGSDAWNSGYNAFSGDMSRKLQGGAAKAGVATTEQSVDTQDMNSLLSTGSLERGIDQAALDTAYGDFREQREWPYKQLNFALGALAGAPYEVQESSTTTGTQLVPQSGALQTAAGLGLTGAGIYNLTS